ncbi:MAG: biotin--[acetyl-CoA-carboxylase] ligase [Flavobacteriia bacterium]|jgi:BirA family biotin operon repressor/biotin-[acetyl-CoA-carboxylase] ligase
MLLPFGHRIIHLPSVDSTNNYAANLLREEKIGHGAVILADEQSAGRGQRGTSWTSKAGENLLVTFLALPDNLSVSNQEVITQFITVSIADFLGNIGISASIKWPNDIYVADKKLAGILIENALSSGNIVSSIIGVGLNVNQINFESLNATSIAAELGEKRPIMDVLFQLIDAMNKNWSALNNSQLKQRYLSNMYLLNVPAFFEDENGRFAGIIRGTDERGRLEIETNGKLKYYSLKEVSFLSQNDL